MVQKFLSRITNKSFGPTNAFEEQIKWTSDGKQWEYPIDNEFRMGEESNISFIDHVFLERHLPSLGIPKTGPIAHFMHLVCVGLSKNPYMTAAKKREHLTWFADYFNTEKQKLVHKLHEQEQIAAQNAL
uniref:Small ribosomal subunit protein mS31 n=1 Tax=Caenorhabditis japonica TaxID=281687 RepID=A0A8R1EFK3_CAEJA